MRRVSSSAAALVLAIFGASTAGAAPSTSAAAPPLYKNCTNFTKKYPHGVGRANARDKTSGKPVTTFKRSTAIYNTAMKYNKGLDRDKDGIACETA
jgi:hypothetical protein